MKEVNVHGLMAILRITFVQAQKEHMHCISRKEHQVACLFFHGVKHGQHAVWLSWLARREQENNK
jgi:hypothetical protein